jgi:cytochrome c553
MGGFVANLTDADIKALADYYAGQQPQLTTAEHATFFLQAGKSAKK